MATTFNNNLPPPNTPRNRGDYDAAHMSSVLPSEDIRSVMINRVAWGPVFSGVAIALVVQFILNLIGVGVGVASVVPDTASNWAVANLSLGTAIWWTISGIIAAYCGGYAAGRLSGDPVESTAGWHGLVSWAVSIIVLAGLVMGGTGVFMGGMLNTTNTNAFRNAPPATVTTPNGVEGSNAPAGATDNTATDNTGAATDNTATAAPDNNTAVPGNTNTTTNTPNVQVPVAGGANAIDSATLSKLIMEGSLLSAIALILGGIAAWFGGRAGTIKPTVTTEAGNVNLH